MAKIFSVLTLLAALAATYFGFQSKELVTRLQSEAEKVHTDLLDTRSKLEKTKKELADTKKELEDTKAELQQTKDTLVKAQGDLTKAMADLTAANEAKAKAEADYAAVKKNFDELADKFKGKNPDEILKSITEMEGTVKDLTAKVEAKEKDIAELKTVNDTLSAQKKETEIKIAEQKTHLDRYINNIMIKGTRGQVLAVNAGWGFCVLSIGDKQGAAANKIMIVARNGQAIGKVKIINVERSQSVADIIPSSFVKGAYVQPGDEVIFVGDEKVREEPAPAPAPGAALTPVLPQP